MQNTNKTTKQRSQIQTNKSPITITTSTNKHTLSTNPNLNSKTNKQHRKQTKFNSKPIQLNPTKSITTTIKWSKLHHKTTNKTNKKTHKIQTAISYLTSTPKSNTTSTQPIPKQTKIKPQINNNQQITNTNNYKPQNPKYINLPKPKPKKTTQQQKTHSKSIK